MGILVGTSSPLIEPQQVVILRPVEPKQMVVISPVEPEQMVVVGPVEPEQMSVAPGSPAFSGVLLLTVQGAHVASEHVVIHAGR